MAGSQHQREEEVVELPEVASKEEWLEARKWLLAKEKEATRVRAPFGRQEG